MTYLSAIYLKNPAAEQYDDSVEARFDLYKELAELVTKTKVAIATQYGKDSTEYKDVVKYCMD